MNELIKQFAKQTGYIWHASGDPKVYEFTPEKLEKFAELIVRECLEVIEKQFGGGNGDGVEWDRAVEFTYNDVKQHFGVGE